MRTNNQPVLNIETNRGLIYAGAILVDVSDGVVTIEHDGDTFGLPAADVARYSEVPPPSATAGGWYYGPKGQPRRR